MAGGGSGLVMPTEGPPKSWWRGGLCRGAGTTPKARGGGGGGRANVTKQGEAGHHPFWSFDSNMAWASFPCGWWRGGRREDQPSKPSVRLWRVSDSGNGPCAVLGPPTKAASPGQAPRQKTYRGWGCKLSTAKSAEEDWGKEAAPPVLVVGAPHHNPPPPWIKCVEGSLPHHIFSLHTHIHTHAQGTPAFLSCGRTPPRRHRTAQQPSRRRLAPAQASTSSSCSESSRSSSPC